MTTTLMTTIATILKSAIQQLAPISSTPKLDAELLLAKVLQCPRSHLIAYPDKVLTSAQIEQFKTLIAKRTTRYPIAYLLGEKEFWSLNFMVTPDVLIPRPETELLVEKILGQWGNPDLTIVDLGTGSGAIACALAHERPRWKIIATDQSKKALAVAQHNAKRFELTNVEFYCGSWCEALPQTLQADIIVSNPPYLAENDIHLFDSEIAYEPKTALVAEHQGLAAYEAIAEQALQHLKASGWLLFEHGVGQGSAIQNIFKNYHYNNIKTFYDLAGLDRVTMAAVP